MAEGISRNLLERTRVAVNEDTAFRKLGTADVKLGIRSGDQAFLVRFEAFECSKVEEIDVEHLCDADFYLELPDPSWRAYLGGRRSGTAPSLLSLDLDTKGGIVRGVDPRNTLAFERYHVTLQAFFDCGARIAG